MPTRNQAGQSNNQPQPVSWLRILVIGRNPKVTLLRVAVLIVTCFIVFRFILLPARIEGISMLPTYKDRSVNFVTGWPTAGMNPGAATWWAFAWPAPT